MRNGKHIYATAFKAWLVEQASQPGVSVAGLALCNGVNANQLWRWKRQAHLRSPAPSLMPVTIVPETVQRGTVIESTNCGAGTMEIEVNGAVVRLQGNVDAGQLRMVLTVLRS